LFEFLVAFGSSDGLLQKVRIIGPVDPRIRMDEDRVLGLISKVALRGLFFVLAAAATTTTGFVLGYFLLFLLDRHRNIDTKVSKRSLIANRTDGKILLEQRNTPGTNSRCQNQRSRTQQQ